MVPEEFFTYCLDLAAKFGIKIDDNARKKNAVVRKNFNFSDGGAPFFAFINPEETAGSTYADFSLVFFPGGEDDHTYTMAIGVGTEGFKNDYELAKNPGLRRLFLKLLPQGNEYHSFCKPKFTDIETSRLINSMVNSSQLAAELILKRKQILSLQQPGLLSMLRCATGLQSLNRRM